jgi:protein phosphatase
VGDSRIYYQRRGKLNQLSRDHSIVALLLQQGDIKPEEAHDHPARGRLYRYIGMEDEATAEVHRKHPQPGELLLLCSDGLTDHLDDLHIQIILTEHTDLQKGCQALVDAANQRGGKDNITVMLVKWEK